MKIRLFLLDKIDFKFFLNPVNVYADLDKHTKIGTCKITKDQLGNHFGTLHLDHQINENMYVYYMGRYLERNVFEFLGLDFTNIQVDNKPAKKLNEITTH